MTEGDPACLILSSTRLYIFNIGLKPGEIVAVSVYTLSSRTLSYPYTLYYAIGHSVLREWSYSKRKSEGGGTVGGFLHARVQSINCPVYLTKEIPMSLGCQAKSTAPPVSIEMPTP